MSKIKKILLATFLPAAMFCSVGVVAPAYTAEAAIFDSAKQDACKGIRKAGCDEKSDTRLSNLIKSIVNIISVIVGIVAVIMIIVGGFRYITSGGDANRVSSAKNTILFAIIGLIIVVLAQVIVRFVMRNIV